MALKERVQKRIDGMKVEGSWRMKLAVYGGAVLMVGGILLVMYLAGRHWQHPTGGHRHRAQQQRGSHPPLQPNLHHHPGGPHGIPAAGARRGGGQRPHGGSLTTPPPYCPRAARTTGTSPLPSTMRRAASTPRRRIPSSAPRSPAPTWCARSSTGAPSGRTSHGVLFLD